MSNRSGISDGELEELFSEIVNIDPGLSLKCGLKIFRGIIENVYEKGYDDGYAEAEQYCSG